jgi:hypothetical protein
MHRYLVKHDSQNTSHGNLSCSVFSPTRYGRRFRSGSPGPGWATPTRTILTELPIFTRLVLCCRWLMAQNER